MKWKEEAKAGDIRIVNKFLFLPKCINGESRWFEYATIKQLYKIFSYGDYWEDVEWINDQQV